MQIAVKIKIKLKTVKSEKKPQSWGFVYVEAIKVRSV